MTDDLVERLRREAGTLATMYEAADEIERLRAALRVAATAELVGVDGIIDADVLFAVQKAARAALENT